MLQLHQWFVESSCYGLRARCTMMVMNGLSTTTTTTILRLSGFCLGQPRWAGARRNIHPLTPIVVINHPCLLPPSITIHGILPIKFTCLTVFLHNLSPSFLWSYLLLWHPALHTPYICSPNHCLLFAAHAHTIATCFAVVPRLCHLILVSLSTLYLMPHIHLTILISASWSANSFSFLMGNVSLPCNILLCT